MDFTIVSLLEALGLLLAAGCVVYFLYSQWKSSKRSQLPVETARATVYQKHPEPVYVPGAGNRYGSSSSYVYYISFHTENGLILKLYVNPDVFYSIQEDSAGILTWQGDRFWKFQPEEQKAL